MTAWLDIPGIDCEHEPNAGGTACEHCGLTAERVTPDELYDAFLAEIEALRLAALGQTSWLEKPSVPAERCRFWRYGPVGVAPRRCLLTEGHSDSGARDAHPVEDAVAR